jgi:hypothetical protein
MDFEMSAMLEHKRELYFAALVVYERNREKFEEMLLSEQHTSDCFVGDDICIQNHEFVVTFTTQAIEKFGEEQAFEHITVYLFDNTDTRTATEFFEDLLGED